jgi:hypothetical protein
MQISASKRVTTWQDQMTKKCQPLLHAARDAWRATRATCKAAQVIHPKLHSPSSALQQGQNANEHAKINKQPLIRRE